MSFKLYTDKPTLFECRVALDGASLKETMARLVVSAPDRTFLFEGTVSEDGQCRIIIDKLRELVGENVEGNMHLEVIAEDMYFQPWSSPFKTERSRKMTVEVKTATPARPSLQVEIVTPVQRISKEIVEDLKTKGVGIGQATTKKFIVQSSINEHLNRIRFTGSRSEVVSQVVKLLAEQGK